MCNNRSIGIDIIEELEELELKCKLISYYDRNVCCIRLMIFEYGIDIDCQH
jgi:hypothetical protein